MHDDAYWLSLVHELRALPDETGWLEFKRNKGEPQEIGEYISALANSAALEGKAHAYLLWGIDDAGHAVVGTGFDPARRVGQEELESWLLRQLAPKIGFRFVRVMIEGLPLVVLEIDRAYRHPVQFGGAEFIRVGSHKKRLKDFPEKARALWRVLNLGALLFARRLADFSRLQRKAVRVVVYQGKGRVQTLREQQGGQGYLHACLRYVQREHMTNTSLRERFGIDVKNSATASRLLREALAAGSVRLQDPEAPPKLRRYVPSWA
jgi:predicted HTH transcriptional regulator